MTKPISKIPLGPDEWIDVYDLGGRQAQAVDIDPLIRDFEPFWDALQTNCAAECCGIDAFDFYPGNIDDACEKMDRKQLTQAIENLFVFIEESPADIFVSKILNNYLDRDVLLQLVEHIEDCVLSSPVWQKENELPPESK